MTYLLTTLHGYLGTVLAIELAVVACLSITLLWLFARKASAPATEWHEPTTAEDAMRDRARLVELEGESDRYRTTAAENELLRQRVQSLESELHDYELVREEVSQVSTLKLENRRLKEAMGLLPSLPASPAETPFAEPTRLRDV